MRTPVQQPQQKKAFDWHSLIGFVLVWLKISLTRDEVNEVLEAANAN